jgi:N-acetylneuraminic acid mutarotase
MDTLTWSTVETFGIPGTPRNSHAAQFLDKTLYIFGGSNA